MRANIKYFLARLGLVAFATLGLSATSFAHDLPAANALAEAHAISTSIEAPPVSETQSNDLIVVAQPDSGDAPRPVVSEPEPNELIVIARPDSGDAPRPVLKIAQAEPQTPIESQATISARASEIYMPYDFQLSDWRFGQFPYHGKTASAPTPKSLPSLAQGIADVPQLAQSGVDQPAANNQSETIPTTAPTPKRAVKLGPPSPQFAALGKLLQQLDQWQCTAYSFLTDDAALARSAKRLSHSLEQLAVNYRQAYLPVAAAADVSPVPTPVPSTRQPSPTVGPQFVVYDSAFGGHIVLTVEQAREWQFDATVAQSHINNALGAALKPIRSSALATASRQLEFAGRGLLSLSQSLSSIAGGNQAETKVASLPNPKN